MHWSKVLLVTVLGIALTGCASMEAGPSAGERAALAPTGKLRVGLYLGNPLSVVRDPSTQGLKGAGLELGQQMARQMEVPFEPVVYPSIGALLEGAKAGQWDVALFQTSPARARDFDFSAPVVEIELGYLVPVGSRLTAADSVDAPGVRVAVQDNSQAYAILSRLLARATLLRFGGLAAALEAVKSGEADAVATVKPSLFELSRQLPGSRVLDGRFAQEHIAMAMPKGREAGVPYMRRFVEGAKARGHVRTAVENSGARGVALAPAQPGP